MPSFKAFLCAGFTSKVKCPPLWEKVEQDATTRQTYYDYYYKSFIDCALLTSYRLNVGRKAVFKEIEYQIDEICLYPKDYDMMLISIAVSAEDLSEDQAVALAAGLRTPKGWTGDFLEKAIQPILDACSLDKPEALIENGNKMKVFQIFLGTEPSDGTLFHLGTYSHCEDYDKDYYDGVMSEGKLSIYANWKALMLFDTMTIVAMDVPDWLMNNWITNYFALIYLHGLYVKFYLFRTSLRYRKHDVSTAKLFKEFEEFERNCLFDRVSYNFLPIEVYNKVIAALDVRSEKEYIYQMISADNDQGEKKRENRMNKLLFAMTTFTIFSAVWDMSCMGNELAPYASIFNSVDVGFRVVVSGLLLIVAVILMISLLISRHE